MDKLLSEKQGEQKSDKYEGYCEGCNNVKGCVTCVDGDQWAHYKEVEQKPINDTEKKKLKISKQHLISNYFNAEYERGKVDALKSVAWSEEDEKHFNSVISWIETCIVNRPIIPQVEQYRDILYKKQLPDFTSLGIWLIVGLSILIIGYLIFRKLEKGFAEEV